MNLKKRYNINKQISKWPNVSGLLSTIAKEIDTNNNPLYIIDTWKVGLSNNISIVTNNLETALLLNKYPDVQVILASEHSLDRILKQEWVREYFSKQMPQYMINDIIGMIDGGETPENAWDYRIKTWLPNNKTVNDILMFHNDED